MALPDWILGVLFRPGETFERARTEMTYSYWWILLSVLTLETVLIYYSPGVKSMIPPPTADLVFLSQMIILSFLFIAQVLCLFGFGRLLGWALTMGEAMKYSALVWAVTLLEDLFAFYPFLKGQGLLVFYIAVAFALWRLIAQIVGVRRITDLPLGRAALLVFLANLPWQGWLLYQNYLSFYVGT